MEGAEVEPRVAKQGILFTGAMVRAIRSGRKTETRRVYGDDAGLTFAKHGKPGDLLYVKETWCPVTGFGTPIPAGGAVEVGSRVVYAADVGEPCERCGGTGLATGDFACQAPGCDLGVGRNLPGFWRSSMFMPRWVSRVTLELTATRQEPLWAISEAGARAEGVASVEAYRVLWESINGKDPDARWERNPALWVLSFRVVA